MKNSIFLLLTLCLLCQCSCKKSLLTTEDDDDMPPMTELEKLPPITSEGANTFGCLVNGEAWTPKGYIFPDANFDVYYDEVYYHGLFLQMYKNQDTIYENISFGLRLKGNTTEIDTIYSHAVSFSGFLPCIEYDFFVQKDFLISKLDTINKIIAGTFSFDVIREEEGCMDTLHITDGRFDAVYRY